MAATCLNGLLRAGVDAMYCKEFKLLTELRNQWDAVKEKEQKR